MNECYHEAETILKDNINVLHTLARNLMDKETLDSDEVKAIFTAAGLKKPEPSWGILEKKWEEEDQAKAAVKAAAVQQLEKSQPQPTTPAAEAISEEDAVKEAVKEAEEEAEEDVKKEPAIGSSLEE